VLVELGGTELIEPQPTQFKHLLDRAAGKFS
jgi:hypothetical protein